MAVARARRYYGKLNASHAGASVLSCAHPVCAHPERDPDVAPLESDISATNPLELSRGGGRSAAVLAAGLGLTHLPGAEGAVTREAIGSLVRAVTAAAPDFFGESLKRALEAGHSLAAATEHTPKISRGMATRVLLASHAVWASRPFTYTWLVDLHCAADPVVSGLLEAEQQATQAAFTERFGGGGLGEGEDEDDEDDGDGDDDGEAEDDEEEGEEEVGDEEEDEEEVGDDDAEVSEAE